MKTDQHTDLVRLIEKMEQKISSLESEVRFLNSAMREADLFPSRYFINKEILFSSECPASIMVGFESGVFWMAYNSRGETLSGTHRTLTQLIRRAEQEGFKDCVEALKEIRRRYISKVNQSKVNQY